MKIVFVNDTVYGYASGAAVVGGAERQQWLLARALAATGWSVTVGVHEGLEAGERQTIDRVEFLGLGPGHIRLGRGHIHWVWHRFLSSERPDWWYWRCAYHLWGSAVEIAKLAGVRTIFAAAFDTDVQPRRALFRRPHWWPVYAWGLSRTDRIFVQHTGQLAALAPRLRPKAHIVPSIAGETATLKPHTEREKYVAWVAVLRQHKRPDLLIEIARKTTNIRFVVCGGATSFMSPPGYGQRIIRALKDVPNIDYLGSVAPDTANQIIANASMLLSTSDQEGFPNTFLQAWSSGTPVISLKIDPDHMIKQNKLGSVVDDVDAAVLEIKRLIQSSRERQEISFRALSHVESVYSKEAVLKAFERGISGHP